MRTEGYEVKLDKNLSFRAPGPERFTRLKTLGADYTPEALKERLKLRRGTPAAVKIVSPSAGKRLNQLIDVRAKLQAGKGYEKWAAIYNLKEASKTINFLTDNGVTDYEDL